MNTKEELKAKAKRESSGDIPYNSIKQDKSGLRVGVVGGGFVGGSVATFFKNNGADVKVYDKYKEMDSIEDVRKQDYIFIAVPTPYSGTSIDLSYIEDAFNNIKDTSPRAVIIKSTVIPGTTDKMQAKYPHLPVIFNPEFLTESTAEINFCFPDRQIVGFTDQSFGVAKEVLSILPLAPYTKIMEAKAAEVVKYFGNTWFSVKVTFANQMYDLCESVGVDYYTVADAAGADQRIGRSHLDATYQGYRGYGGKCLPKDTRAIIAYAKENNVDLKLLKTCEEINNTLTGGVDK